MKLDTILKQFGLKQKEADIYLSALELGTASVQKIAEKASVVRSTAYEILEELRHKGLVTTYLKKHIRHYSAEDPNQVLNFAQSRVDTLKDALPELNALAGKSRRRPSVRFYEGKEQVHLVFKEMALEAKEIECFGSSDDLLQIFGDYHKEFLAERIKRKIPIRVLLRDTPTARERKRLGPGELRTVKILPPSDFHGLIYIWKNKIAMISTSQDLVAVVTESPAITGMQRSMFNYLWQLAPAK